MAFPSSSPTRNHWNALVTAALALFGTSMVFGGPRSILSGGGREIGEFPWPAEDVWFTPPSWGWCGDFDGDGDKDIYAILDSMTGQSLGGGGHWILENVDGRALDLSPHPVSGSDHLLIGQSPDVNGDGRDDFLRLDNALQWGEWRDGAIVFRDVYPHQVWFAGTIDWDHDSDIDLLTVGLDGTLRWHENSGEPEPRFTDHVLLEQWHGVLAKGDLDGDTRWDLVQISPAGSHWHRNLGSDPPRFERIALDIEHPDQLLIHDVDRDGAQDLLCVVNGTLIWHENIRGDGTAWVERIIDDGGGLPDFEGVDSLLTFDFDLDGFADPLAVHTNGELFFYTSEGGTTPQWRRNRLEPPWGTMRWLDDLDGDGHADYLDVYGHFGSSLSSRWPVFRWTHYESRTFQWRETEALRLTANLIASGEWNGHHTPGEMGWLHITAQNGHRYRLTDVIIAAESFSPDLTIDADPVTIPAIARNETAYAAFPYRIADNLPCGISMNAQVSADSNQFERDIRAINVTLGRLTDRLWEDTESVVVPPHPTILSRRLMVNAPLHYTVNSCTLQLNYTDGDPDAHDPNGTLTLPSGSTQPIDSTGTVVITSGSPVAGTYRLNIQAHPDDPGPLVLESWGLDFSLTDQRCTEFSSEELIMQILGLMAPDPIFDYNLDGHVDSADLVWALSRGY